MDTSKQQRLLQKIREGIDDLKEKRETIVAERNNLTKKLKSKENKDQACQITRDLKKLDDEIKEADDVI